MPEQNLLPIAIAAVVVLALVGLALFSLRRRRHRQLADRYGSQYEAAVQRYGGAARAEKELKLREKRFEKAHIRDLTAGDRERYLSLWRSTQARFVDAPAAAVAEADALVAEVMRLRGYPAGDLDQRLADVAIGHPDLVEHYREACQISERTKTGQAGTEELRQALVHYRALFEELLAVPERELVGAH